MGGGRDGEGPGGTASDGGGTATALVDAGPAVPGEPILRWSSRATTIPEIRRELARIWSEPDLTAVVDGVGERRIAARSSVMNLVVIASRQEIAERAAATIAELTGRHPSRTIIACQRDPDGPGSIRAQIEAHCILPRRDAPETCAEMITLQAGGPTGRHLDAVVTPLLVHDLPVTLWWPGDPAFGSPEAEALFEMADRLVVDGSGWSEDGLARLRAMATLMDAHGLAVSDFALIRQSRWREAIASVFDMPELLPYLRHVRRIAVTYATRDLSAPPGATNVVKPLYHIAWLASRLGLAVERPLALRAGASGTAGASRGGPPPGGQARARSLPTHVHAATLAGPHGEVKVTIGPVASPLPGGTTLRVELLCERRGSELRAAITAEAATVEVRAWVDGLATLERSFLAPRRTDVDLLEEAIEAGSRDPIAAPTIRFAAALAGGPGPEAAGAAGAEEP